MSTVSNEEMEAGKQLQTSVAETKMKVRQPTSSTTLLAVTEETAHQIMSEVAFSHFVLNIGCSKNCGTEQDFLLQMLQ